MAKPAVGALVVRVLDDLRFPCKVLDITYADDATPMLWTIQYVDDGNVETITDIDELELDMAPVVSDGRSLVEIVGYVVAFLTPWENATVIRHVSRRLRDVVSEASHWRHVDLAIQPTHVRLDRYLHLILHMNTTEGHVRSVVQSLNLASLLVSDQDVQNLVKQCPHLRHVNLAYCPLLSYQLFPLLHALSASSSLSSLDLYMTRIMHWETAALTNAFGNVVTVEPSGLVPFRADAFTASRTSDATFAVHVLDTAGLDAQGDADDDWHTKLCYTWPYTLLPVVYLAGEAYVCRSPDDIARWRRETAKKLAPPMCLVPRALTPRPEKAPDPLDEQAKAVFASLHEWKTSLEAQVETLTEALVLAQQDHAVAKHEYDLAERQRAAVERDANRAVLALSLGHASATPPESGHIVHRDGDDLLPPLPHAAAIADLSRALSQQHFALCDDFLGHGSAIQLYDAVEQLHAAQDGLCFERGALAGGKTGRNLRYEMASVRGDDVLWLDGTEPACPHAIVTTLRQLDRLILERLAGVNSELRSCALQRQRVMLTCYPGHGAAYVKHCDNPNRNGRKLTAILYLNPLWDERDGGQLVLHRTPPTRISPVLDRLLLFFSDTRVPHEVLPSHAKRYALTVWYMDWDEFMEAQVFTDTTNETHERRHIEAEIEKFHAKAS